MLYPTLMAEDYDAIASPHFEVLSFSGFTPEPFQNLAKLILEMKESRALQHLAHEDSGEWWLEQFSSEFVNAMAKLDDAQAEAIASQWGETDEAILNEKHAADILDSLQTLCKKSVEEKKSMFLWGAI